MKKIFLYILVFFISSLSAYPNREETNHRDNKDFKSRKQLLLDSIANWANTLDLEGFKKSDDYEGGKYGAYPIMALFEKGQIDKACQFAAQQLVGGAAMFREYTTMALYMQYHKLYGQYLCDKVKQDQLKSNFFNFYGTDGSADISQNHRNSKLGGASENHKLMYASAAYLAGIAWPDDYPQKWYQAGYEHLMNWFDIVTKIGFWEEDSPTYLIHHMGPILTVAEFAPEGSEMKKRASMVLDWYFLSIAGEYLKGYWITPVARDYNPMYGLANSAESTALTWLYFGDAALVPNPHVHQTFLHWKAALHFALSDYELPDIIKRIATDRHQSFIHREFMKKNPMEPKEYCYITPTYGMASIVGENGRIVPDATRWKVQWVAESKEKEPSVFFLKHPYGDNDWRAWRGASPAEQVLQCKDALIAVYRMEDGDKGFIDGPFPSSSFKVIKHEENWLFLHSGNCLIATYAAKGFSISDEERLRDGSEITYKSLKSNGRKNGLIVQTASVGSYKSKSPEAELKLFKQDILSKTKIDTSGIDADKPRLKYKSLSGNWLEIEFNNFKKINGKILDLENWPLLENPWMHQEIGGKLILKHNNEERVYDFANWTVK